jgi:GT2 family glycosyltransferase
MTSASLDAIGRRCVWSRDQVADSHRLVGEASRVVLDDLTLPRGWYRLKVWTTRETIMSARARFVNNRRAEFRIRMEPAGKNCFQTTIKTDAPISSLLIAPEADHTDSRISRIEITPMGKLAIAAFLAAKVARYARSNWGHMDGKRALRHLASALNPRGSFVFRGQYERPGRCAYDKWRARHENPDTAAAAARALKETLGLEKSRIGLLVAGGLNPADTIEMVKSSLIGSAVALSVLDADRLAMWTNDVDFVLTIDHRGIFPPGAIERMALELSANPALAAVFADSDMLAADGTRENPRLKPPWDQELLWCADYIRAPLMVRWAADLGPALALPGADIKPGYALALTLLAKRARDRLDRIPAILFHQTKAEPPDVETDRLILDGHLRTLGDGHGLTPQGDGTLKVDWRLPAAATLVSIVIPSKDNPATLRNCIDSILAHTDGIAYEIIVADNGSSQDKTKQYLNEISQHGAIKVVPAPGPFNFSKINNDARRHAKGDIIVFLNDDTKIMDGSWLVELASLAARPDVGAAGALLLYPNGSVQHAGILIGVGGAANHAFRYLAGESRGYLDLLRCRREVTAVTGACLAISTEHFDMVGGFDETLMVTCNDLDLCLRLRAAGLTNVWTPWARLEHWESLSRGIDFTDEALEMQAKELRILSDRWGKLLDRDPTYHPGLNVHAPDYALST